jgi:hypothetical protein
MHRRQFLQTSAAAAIAGTLAPCALRQPTGLWQSAAGPRPPAYSVIPVVGDGRWIWKEPPKTETGYLEPRSYSLDVGIELEGLGRATQVMSTTTAPVAFPEQKIDDVQIEAEGCEAALRTLSPTAGQLVLTTPVIEKGQKVRAVAHYKLTLTKQHHAYTAEQFPARQKLPLEIERAYLQDSPGIETKTAELRALARDLSGSAASKHPWDLAQTFARWIPRNIRPQIGSYTSVTTCLETRYGDCEEMAGLFVALCRAVNIPARLVWVPNHAWAEFFLIDSDGAAHWIPAHTACYLWFGWTGAHELVLQKGDRIDVPERHKTYRLLEDWTRWQGRGPRARYTASLRPLPAESETDAGPGARSKDAKGEWVVTGDHPLNQYVRR